MSNVYVIENTCTETPTAYVGKANDPAGRLEQHFRTASDPRKRFLTSHLTNAIRKHGKHSFVLHIVETDIPEALAFQLEREWISYLGSMGVRLYNKSSGGYGGQKRTTSESTRKKQSASHKIRYESIELRRQISIKLRGRIKAESTKKKLSESKRKPVEQLDKQGNVVATFVSALAAQLETKTSRSKICECCKGRRKFAGGFAWRYKS